MVLSSWHGKSIKMEAVGSSEILVTICQTKCSHLNLTASIWTKLTVVVMLWSYIQKVPGQQLS